MTESTNSRLPWLAPVEKVTTTPELEEVAAKAGAARLSMLDAEAHLVRMSVQARTVRENFVSEYLFDFDPVAAACRLGYHSKQAKTFAYRLMREPVVQRLIRERQKEFTKRTEINQDRILAGLLKEATREGIGSSHSARVAAWGTMAKIAGVGTPDPGTQVNVNVGGVREVPAITSVDSWEASASASQQQLKADVTK